MLFRSENPEEDFRNVLEKWLSVDDLVYHGSLVAFHKNQLNCRADKMPLNDVALYHLINVGAHDTRGKGSLTQWVHCDYIVIF